MPNHQFRGVSSAIGIVCTAAVAVALSACHSGVTAVLTTGPSVPTISATIVQPPPQDHSFIAFGCSTPSAGFFVGSRTFDVVVASSHTVDVSDLTIQLLDGTHVGGPSVTIPSAEMTSQFGSTRIVAGVQRTFHVEPRFECAPFAPSMISADLVLVDLDGARHRCHVTAPLR